VKLWCPKCLVEVPASDIRIEGDGNYVEYYDTHEECGTALEEIM
jgi:hypothetical protein